VCADRLEFGATLLRAAEDRTDRAQAEQRAAERLAAAERAARQVAEQLLAAEAALVDAAEESTWNERRARRQAEAQRDLWQALAGGRGGRGDRGGRAHASPPPPPPQPPQPPPPPLAELITLVLAVPVETEGQMTAEPEEALAILNVTHKSPRWLLAQVHPDKHPHHTSQAQAATARVNQARDIRSRHVTDWTQ
jgi:hypothetical protein